MSKRLAGRTALITGSSRGIGAAIAQCLSAHGAHVVLHGREHSSRLQSVCESIKQQGGDVRIVIGDLETEEAPIRIVREAYAFGQSLDILVCNAGGGRGGLAVEHDAASVNRILALNLRAVILSATEYARLTHSPHGRVIVISSGSATHPAKGATIYAAAKAGAEAFARSIAQEVGDRGITVNSIAPGMTQSDMVVDPRWAEGVGRWAALRRIGQPEDIADIALFLASDESRWLTGATLPANGGLITTAANIIARMSG
ncbi:MAG TPA: SDR family oxidoreductase [Steroidobacteraceae bacterium]|nr:SDR family oxidoreductase [Steroidobacteraceae bacterium]